jgi:hypothetical protein
MDQFQLGGQLAAVVYEIWLADGGRVQWRGRVQAVGERGGVPQHVTYEHDGADTQPALRISVEIADGVPWCTRVELVGQPGASRVRAANLKETAARLEDLIESALTAAAFVRGKTPTGTGWVQRRSLSHPDTRQAALPDIRRARKRSNHKLTDDMLRTVADVYRKGAPARTAAVASAFGVSQRSAGRYIQSARAAGLLAPTTQGKATNE